MLRGVLECGCFRWVGRAEANVEEPAGTRLENPEGRWRTAATGLGRRLVGGTREAQVRQVVRHRELLDLDTSLRAQEHCERFREQCTRYVLHRPHLRVRHANLELGDRALREGVGEVWVVRQGQEGEEARRLTRPPDAERV